MNNIFLKTTTVLCGLMLLSSVSSAGSQSEPIGAVLLPIVEGVAAEEPVRTGVSKGVSKVTTTLTNKKTAIETDKTTLKNNKKTTVTTNPDGSTATKTGTTGVNGNQITKTVNGDTTTVDVYTTGSITGKGDNNLNIVGVNNGDGTSTITATDRFGTQSGTVDYTSSNRPDRNR